MSSQVYVDIGMGYLSRAQEIKDYIYPSRHYEVKQYIRNSSGKRIGLFIARSHDNENWKFGYSLCSKLDKFDKDRAYSIASGRCDKGIFVVPRSILGKTYQFVARCQRYFKGKTLLPTYEPQDVALTPKHDEIVENKIVEKPQKLENFTCDCMGHFEFYNDINCFNFYP
jgi:hypothetical protein